MDAIDIDRYGLQPGSPLTAYLKRSPVAWSVLKAIERNWSHGWTTTCASLQGAWNGIHSESTVSHVFTELVRLHAIVATNNQPPYPYRPALKKVLGTFVLARRVW